MSTLLLDPFDPSLHGITWPDPPPLNAPRLHRLTWQEEAARAIPAGSPGHPGSCVLCRAAYAGAARAAAAMKAPSPPYLFPMPAPGEWQSIEVHTLRWGNPDWMQECAPTLDAWCQRHGMPLHITSSWDPSYPDPKFCEVDMLRGFLSGPNDWLFYMDADIVIHPLAPRPSFSKPGFWIREDTHGRANHRWFAWCMEKFGSVPSSSYLYRNAGVWACDRESARRMLEVIEKPYHEGIMEQDQWNWWISHAVDRGMQLRDLGHEWNRFPREVKPSWAFHIYSKAKMRHLLRFRQAGYLPDAVNRLDSPPPVPDFGRKAIVWPWLSTAAGDEELWYSHRSVIKHWKEKGWVHVLLADRKPDWWHGEFVHAPSYEQAIYIAVQCAEQVILMNDDIFMLGDQSLEDLSVARHFGEGYQQIGENMVSRNIWKAGLAQVLMRCHHHGKSTLNFSTHTPYLFHRDKAREVIDRFGIFRKIPFESAYHNWHSTPYAYCEERAEGPYKYAGKLWIHLNLNLRDVPPAFRSEMISRFGPLPES